MQVNCMLEEGRICAKTLSGNTSQIMIWKKSLLFKCYVGESLSQGWPLSGEDGSREGW